MTKPIPMEPLSSVPNQKTNRKVSAVKDSEALDNSSDDGNIDAEFISPREKPQLHNIPKVSGSHLIIKKKNMNSTGIKRPQFAMLNTKLSQRPDGTSYIAFNNLLTTPVL
jgi:hypothetical protein